MNQSGELSVDAIDSMLAEAKKPHKSEPKGTMRFRKYFPPDYSLKQIETVIVELLKEWKEGKTI